MCCEINDFEPNSFPIFRSQAGSDNGHEGGGVAQGTGRKEVEW